MSCSSCSGGGFGYSSYMGGPYYCQPKNPCVNRKGPQGPTGPTGPAGPAFATNFSVSLTGTQFTVLPSTTATIGDGTNGLWTVSIPQEYTGPGFGTPTSNDFTAPVAGKYQANVLFVVDSTGTYTGAGTGAVGPALHLRVNGVNYATADAANTFASGLQTTRDNDTLSISTDVKLAIGDVVDVTLTTAAGQTLIITPATDLQKWSMHQFA